MISEYQSGIPLLGCITVTVGVLGSVDRFKMNGLASCRHEACMPSTYTYCMGSRSVVAVAAADRSS